MILNYKFNKDRLFFTSDLHFYHKNIIDFCSRPFTNVEHMNAMLITYWNAVVEPGDDVIIAGDFIFSRDLDKLENILVQLNGNKFLVLGIYFKYSVNLLIIKMGLIRILAIKILQCQSIIWSLLFWLKGMISLVTISF